MRNILQGIAVAVSSLMVSHTSIHAQWYDQDINLQAGWNTVWIDVDPAIKAPEKLLSGVDYESIWAHVPGHNINENGQWFVHYSNPELSDLNSLSSIQGHRGYLIKMAQPDTWTVKGRPMNRRNQFTAGATELFGVGSEGAQSLNLNQYLSHPNVSGKVRAIYELTDTGYLPISPEDAFRPGSSYWVQFSQNVDSPSYLHLNAPIDGYHFGSSAYSLDLSVELPVSENERILTIQALPSATPPVGEPADAGGPDGSATWLEYHIEAGVWDSLGSGATITVPPGSTTANLKIRCVRNLLPPASERETGSKYQALIQITSDDGQRRIIGSSMEVQANHGLWIGKARLNRVSSFSSISTESAGEAKPISIPLILNIPTTAGAPQLMDKVSFDVDRDGRTLDYQFNSILFHETVDLTEEPNGDLSGQIDMPPNHALNPYRHQYHPEHQTGYAISRNIRIEFTASEQDPISIALGLDETIGDNELTGIYKETITGISLEPIEVSGFFKLHRLSHNSDLP